MPTSPYDPGVPAHDPARAPTHDPAPATAPAHATWAACVRLSALAFRVHDEVPWIRERRVDTYRGWGFSLRTGEGLASAQLALVLHAYATDRGDGPGRPLPPGALTALALSDVANLPYRPHHEFFAGLDTAGLDAADRHWVNILALLGYDALGRSPLVLARLMSLGQETLTRLVERYGRADLTFGELSDLGEPAARSAPWTA